MDYIIATLKPFLEDRREDDVFDRLNYKTTPLLLLLSAAVNTAKLYIGGIIECFTKAVRLFFHYFLIARLEKLQKLTQNNFCATKKKKDCQ